MNQCRMQPKLQDCENSPSGLPLQLLQGIEVPGIDHQRFFTNRVCAYSQGQPYVGVVEIVRRADAQVTDAVGLRAATQFLEVTIEALDFGEKTHVERKAVENADCAVRRHRRYKPVAGIMNALQMDLCH